ncbi:MAG: universal stress protein [Gammaproteobacteria bacterium]|nr:universal stress protein [Gammaproteobacteria bacterium]
MFKSIVVAFDGSVHSSKALEIGATLAGHENISLGIIYVIDVSHMKIPEEMRKMGEIEHIIEPMPRMLVNLENAPENMLSSMAQTSSDSEKAMFQYADFLVDQARDNAEHHGAQDVEAKSVLGDPADEVVAFARERNADLIICGSRGFGKLKSLLLGSTSHKIGQLAECSCLTVK